MFYQVHITLPCLPCAGGSSFLTTPLNSLCTQQFAVGSWQLGSGFITEGTEGGTEGCGEVGEPLNQQPPHAAHAAHAPNAAPAGRASLKRGRLSQQSGPQLNQGEDLAARVSAPGSGPYAGLPLGMLMGFPALGSGQHPQAGQLLPQCLPPGINLWPGGQQQQQQGGTRGGRKSLKNSMAAATAHAHVGPGVGGWEFLVGAHGSEPGTASASAAANASAFSMPAVLSGISGSVANPAAGGSVLTPQQNGQLPNWNWALGVPGEGLPSGTSCALFQSINNSSTF